MLRLYWMIFFRRWYHAVEAKIERYRSYNEPLTPKLVLANKRLSTCSKCKYRNQAKCGISKNPLKLLAMGRKSDCPKNFWVE